MVNKKVQVFTPKEYVKKLLYEVDYKGKDIQQNIIKDNYLEYPNKIEADYIVGNPPYIDYSLILYSQITKNQLVKILSLTEFGFTEILCDGDSQGKINELLGRLIEQVGTLELESFLLKNYEFLKQSILGGGSSLQTGFSEEKIREFLPRYYRTISRIEFL